MKKQHRKPNGALKPTRPDFDPKVVALRGLAQSYGASHLYNNSFVSRSCIYNFLSGKTRKPQGMTRDTIANAIGYEYKLTRMK